MFSLCNLPFWVWACQELNRLRKAALAFGFWELLKGVADLLERECTLLPDSAHPDAAFQLSHAAQQLKLASTGDSQYAAYDHNIVPMHTDFSSWVSKHRPQPVWTKEVAPAGVKSDCFINLHVDLDSLFDIAYIWNKKKNICLFLRYSCSVYFFQ